MSVIVALRHKIQKSPLSHEAGTRQYASGFETTRNKGLTLCPLCQPKQTLALKTQHFCSENRDEKSAYAFQLSK
jgi:hypothetical protein